LIVGHFYKQATVKLGEQHAECRTSNPERLQADTVANKPRLLTDGAFPLLCDQNGKDIKRDFIAVSNGENLRYLDVCAKTSYTRHNQTSDLMFWRLWCRETSGWLLDGCSIAGGQA
jgi:hypothetical protein